MYSWGQIVEALTEAKVSEDTILDVQFHLCYAHASNTASNHQKFDRDEYLALRKAGVDEDTILRYWNELLKGVKP